MCICVTVCNSNIKLEFRRHETGFIYFKHVKPKKREFRQKEVYIRMNLIVFLFLGNEKEVSIFLVILRSRTV